MRTIKTFFILLLAFSIMSCSLVKTAYNNAPALVAWRLDDYFDFNEAQKAKLKPALHELHAWHRKNELPRYVSLLNEIHDDLNHDVSAATACQRIESIKSHVHTLQTQITPIIVDVAATLSDKQLQHLQKRLEKRNREWKEEWWQDTPEEQREVRLEKSIEFAEKVYGDLNEKQINLLKQVIAKSDIDPAIIYAEILRRDEDTLTILKALRNPATSTEEKSQLVHAGFERLQTSPNPVYQVYIDKLTQQTCETIASLHASTTAKQRLHAQQWVDDYKTQFIQLQSK
jgi:F0F1-type ATP synthase delta subunit